MNLLASVLYLLTIACILWVESKRIRGHGADSFHVLFFFYILYVLLPSTIIHALLFLNPQEETGVYFFDSVFRRMDAIQSATIFLLNVFFLLGLYAVRIYSINRAQPLSRGYAMQLRPWMAAIWVLFGIVVCGVFFWGLGSDFIERYANLILFRMQDISSDRNFFTANAFAITQTFTWLCAGLAFVAYKNKRYSVVFVLVALTLFFALLQGSRRGFLFPIVIVYLCSLLCGGKFNYKKILLLFPLVIFWIAYGKELTGSVVRGAEDFNAHGVYQSTSAGILRAFSDIGITQVESFGVLQNFEISPRLGVDHALSFLRRIPAKDFIGLSLDDFPERITRITTAAFTSADEDDIPPGLMGASWLDFPFAGALIWGLMLGGQALLVEYFRRRIVPSALGAMLVTLMMVVISMPIGTGSYDFTISVDVVLLVIILMTSVRSRVVEAFKRAKQHEEIRRTVGTE